MGKRWSGGPLFVATLVSAGLFRRNDTARAESYGQDMPLALAYVLGLVPVAALSGSLFRLTRA